MLCMLYERCMLHAVERCMLYVDRPVYLAAHGRDGAEGTSLLYAPHHGEHGDRGMATRERGGRVAAGESKEQTEWEAGRHCSRMTQ